MDVTSFCLACACGTNSTFTSKSFCAWLKRCASDSTSAVRLGSGTLNWNRTGCAPHARPGRTRGSSHHARSAAATTDRKSTRLNSSHSQISYAVFCLKKKKIQFHSVSVLPQMSYLVQRDSH